MRFKATNENLTIWLAVDEIAACVSKAVRLLVPRYTQKVYLFTKDERPSGLAEPGLVVVGPENTPSNFLQSFRLILDDGQLIVVSAPVQFSQKQWRDFARQLQPHPH